MRCHPLALGRGQPRESPEILRCPFEAEPRRPLYESKDIRLHPKLHGWSCVLDLFHPRARFRLRESQLVPCLSSLPQREPHLKPYLASYPQVSCVYMRSPRFHKD